MKSHLKIFAVSIGLVVSGMLLKFSGLNSAVEIFLMLFAATVTIIALSMMFEKRLAAAETAIIENNRYHNYLVQRFESVESAVKAIQSKEYHGQEKKMKKSWSRKEDEEKDIVHEAPHS